MQLLPLTKGRVRAGKGGRSNCRIHRHESQLTTSTCLENYKSIEIKKVQCNFSSFNIMWIFCNIESGNNEANFQTCHVKLVKSGRWCTIGILFLFTIWVWLENKWITATIF